MTTSGDRRHLIWLALGVLVPGAVLLALGIMLVRQETELEQRRGADEEALRSRMVADSLQRGLEAAAAGLEANASTRRYPAERTLLHLGAVVQDRYEPPRPAPHDAWGDPGLDRLLRQADQLFNRGRYTAAIRSYRQRLDTDTDSSRIALLHHLTARAAIAGGDTIAAVASATEALLAKAAFRDDFGPPIAFYAADFLLSHGLADGQVCEVLSSAVTGRDWLELSHYRYAEELMERGE
ncbi:MAG: hypothetical protein HKN29_05805, partial [Rhodothermales bacterium]|nr:hypothetical protein [Rhodothermales bacterium]